MSREDAVEALRQRDGWYDPTLLNAARGTMSSLAESGRATTPTARDSEPAMADSVDCGGMTLDLTMRLTV